MRGGRLVVVSTALSLSSSDSFPLYRSPSAILILMQFLFSLFHLSSFSLLFRQL